MKPIRVGIDVDGVLRDFNGRVLELAAEKGLYLSRPTEWGYLRKHHIDGKSLASKIWTTKEWLEPVFGGASVLPFAKKGYHFFTDNPNFEVYIVSSQTKHTSELTDLWLEKNGFTKHRRAIYTSNKLEAPVQILIDDKPSHIEDFQSNAREGFLVTLSHNLDSLVSPRVENLYDAYLKITEKYSIGENNGQVIVS